MSAIHTGSIAVRRTDDGRLVFFGTSNDHAVPGWPALETVQIPQPQIPAQRAGSAYEQVVLKTDGEARR